METATKLTKSISDSEWLLEGLDKDLWRLIKLREPERWESNADSLVSFWVVAVIGMKCIVFIEEAETFHFAEYLTYGCVQKVAASGLDLRGTLIHLQLSRFKVRV
jgi:hypothetical protein